MRFARASWGLGVPDYLFGSSRSGTRGNESTAAREIRGIACGATPRDGTIVWNLQEKVSSCSLAR